MASYTDPLDSPLQDAFRQGNQYGPSTGTSPATSAPPPPPPDAANANWEGTGMTEAAWRARYPTPTAPSPAADPLASAPAPNAPASAPTNGLPAGATDVGNNMVRLASGQVVDRNHPLFQSAMTSTSSSSSTSPVAPSNQDRANRFLGELLDSSGTVDRNSAEFRSMADPYAAAVERARRTAIDEAAERAGAEGVNLSDAERRLITERAGQSTGEFEANLARQRLTEMAQQKMQALQLALQQGDNEAARALQRELALLDAAVKRESTAASTALGGREIDVRERLGMRGLDLDAARMLFQNQQFGQDLGFRIGAKEADLNNDALRLAFGGR